VAPLVSARLDELLKKERPRVATVPLAP
jgi:hypothetical protein